MIEREGFLEHSGNPFATLWGDGKKAPLSDRVVRIAIKTLQPDVSVKKHGEIIKKIKKIIAPRSPPPTP